MDTPKHSINGVPILASEESDWIFRDGVRPYIGTFNMTPQGAAQISAQAGPVTLKLGPLTVQFLYVLGIFPGENPNLVRVRLADRRYWWSYPVVRRYYNMRRNIGVNLSVDPTSEIENLGINKEVWYMPWTLKNTNTDGLDPETARWKASEALKDIIGAASGAEKEAFSSEPAIVINNANMFASRDIEDLVIIATGDQAIETVLGYLPEAAIYINAEGSAVLRSKADGTEGKFIDAQHPTLVGHGDVQFVQNKFVRPREVNVYFMYEIETRIDADERLAQESTDTNTDMVEYLGPRSMRNVLPLPDLVTTVNGVSLPRGSWANIEDAWHAWGTRPKSSHDLTHKDVQICLVPYMDLWASLNLSGLFSANSDWVSRVGETETHYRRTYQIDKLLMDNLLGIKPSMVATVNRSTGTRAKAAIYADYCIIPSRKCLVNEAGGTGSNKDYTYAINVRSHPATLADSQVATKDLAIGNVRSTGEIKIVDPEQGILHIEYVMDPYRLWEMVLPGMITQENRDNEIDSEGYPTAAGATWSLIQRGRPITFDSVGNFNPNARCKLTKNHKVSIILTCLPGAPNTERAFYRITVKPSEAKNSLPAGAVMGAALGPPMDVFIGPNVETARVAWRDGRKKTIERALGFDDTGVGTEQEDLSDAIRDLVVNDTRTTTSFGGSLDILAKAAAARVYAQLVDREMGEAATMINPSAVPTGWLTEVRHVLNPDGSMMTHMTMPPDVQRFNMLAYLDASTRAMVMKLASPSRAVPQ